MREGAAAAAPASMRGAGARARCGRVWWPDTVVCRWVSVGCSGRGGRRWVAVGDRGPRWATVGAVGAVGCSGLQWVRWAPWATVGDRGPRWATVGAVGAVGDRGRPWASVGDSGHCGRQWAQWASVGCSGTGGRRWVAVGLKWAFMKPHRHASIPPSRVLQWAASARARGYSFQNIVRFVTYLACDRRRDRHAPRIALMECPHHSTQYADQPRELHARCSQGASPARSASPGAARMLLWSMKA